MPVAPAKTVGTSVLALQSVASGAVVFSSAIDVSTAFAARLFLWFGRRAATALTIPCRFRLEASSHANADGHWIPIWEQSSATVLAADEAVNGACASGQAEIPMASTTSFADDDLIFIDNGTIANSEWHRILLVHTNVHVTVEENLVNTQTGSTVYNKAELYNVPIDLTTVKRLRLVIDNSGTGQAVAVRAELNTFDTIG